MLRSSPYVQANIMIPDKAARIARRILWESMALTVLKQGLSSKYFIGNGAETMDPIVLEKLREGVSAVCGFISTATSVADTVDADFSEHVKIADFIKRSTSPLTDWIDGEWFLTETDVTDKILVLKHAANLPPSVVVPADAQLVQFLATSGKTSVGKFMDLAKASGKLDKILFINAALALEGLVIASCKAELKMQQVLDIQDDMDFLDAEDKQTNKQTTSKQTNK
jgi:hypothetical protein